MLVFDWFSTLAAGSDFPRDAASELQERGFVVIPGPAPSARMELLADAYNVAVSSATGDDTKIGSTTTRVSDFVNRGTAFDDLYVFPPLLEACCRVIGRPFKLSSLHARTLRPHTPAQELHVDVPRDSADWPLLGFILMIDEFRPDNGATRFVPGSHRWLRPPRTPFQICAPNTMTRCWRAAVRAHSSSSTDPHGMATPKTHRVGRAARSKVRLFLATGVLGPTSRPVCNTRRARDSAHSRGMCSRSDWPSCRYRWDSGHRRLVGGLTRLAADGGRCHHGPPRLKPGR